MDTNNDNSRYYSNNNNNNSQPLTRPPIDTSKWFGPPPPRRPQWNYPARINENLDPSKDTSRSIFESKIGYPYNIHRYTYGKNWWHDGIRASYTNESRASQSNNVVGDESRAGPSTNQGTGSSGMTNGMFKPSNANGNGNGFAALGSGVGTNGVVGEYVDLDPTAIPDTKYYIARENAIPEPKHPSLEYGPSWYPRSGHILNNVQPIGYGNEYASTGAGIGVNNVRDMIAEQQYCSAQHVPNWNRIAGPVSNFFLQETEHNPQQQASNWVHDTGPSHSTPQIEYGDRCAISGPAPLPNTNDVEYGDKYTISGPAPSPITDQVGSADRFTVAGPALPERFCLRGCGTNTNVAPTAPRYLPGNDDTDTHMRSGTDDISHDRAAIEPRPQNAQLHRESEETHSQSIIADHRGARQIAESRTRSRCGIAGCPCDHDHNEEVATQGEVHHRWIDRGERFEFHDHLGDTIVHLHLNEVDDNDGEYFALFDALMRHTYIDNRRLDIDLSFSMTPLRTVADPAMNGHGNVQGANNGNAQGQGQANAPQRAPQFELLAMFDQ